MANVGAFKVTTQAISADRIRATSYDKVVAIPPRVLVATHVAGMASKVNVVLPEDLWPLPIDYGLQNHLIPLVILFLTWDDGTSKRIRHFRFLVRPGPISL